MRLIYYGNREYNCEVITATVNQQNTLGNDIGTRPTMAIILNGLK